MFYYNPSCLWDAQPLHTQNKNQTEKYTTKPSTIRFHKKKEQHRIRNWKWNVNIRSLKKVVHFFITKWLAFAHQSEKISVTYRHFRQNFAKLTAKKKSKKKSKKVLLRSFPLEKQVTTKKDLGTFSNQWFLT